MNTTYRSIPAALKAKAKDTGKCAVFLLCGNDAVTTVPNPVLGPVAACQKCADWSAS